MSLNHNRIKVADLEKNQPDKILITDSNGELEFSDINKIKTDSYNSLDYIEQGKVLDARQGKVLKDLIDNINSLLASDNTNLDTLQELVTAIESIQNSLNTILVNDLTTGGVTKALTAQQGKVLKGLIDGLSGTLANKLDKVTIRTIPGTTDTLQIGDVGKQLLFSSATAVTFTVPTNAVAPIPIGSEIPFTQKGAGIVTLLGAGVTFDYPIGTSLSSIQGETRVLRKIDADEWAIQLAPSKISQLTDDIGVFETKSADVLYLAGWGNDTTARVGSKSYPFKTLDGLLDKMFILYGAYNIHTKITILDGGTYQLSRNIIGAGNGTGYLNYLNIDTIPIYTTSLPTININSSCTNFAPTCDIIKDVNFTINTTAATSYGISFNARNITSVFSVGSITFGNIDVCGVFVRNFLNTIIDKLEFLVGTSRCYFVPQPYTGILGSGVSKVLINTIKTSMKYIHPSYGSVIGIPYQCDLIINSFINNTNTQQYLMNGWFSGRVNIFLKSITCPIAGGSFVLHTGTDGFYVQGMLINYFFDNAVLENTYFAGGNNYGNYVTVQGKATINYNIVNQPLFFVYKNCKVSDFTDNFVFRNFELDVVYASTASMQGLFYFNNADTTTEKSKLIFDNVKIRTNYPVNIFYFSSSVTQTATEKLEFRGSNYFNCQKELIASAINPTDLKFIISRKSSIKNIYGIVSSNPNIVINEI